MTATSTPKIVDSEGKSYSTDVMDMLVRIYRFIAMQMWEFTVEKAYVADHHTSMGMGASMKVAEKFIKELEYVKQLVEKQPITFYTIQYYVLNDDKYELTGKVEELTMRTFNSRKMNSFIQDTKHNANWWNGNPRYKIIKTETFNHEYLELPK
jgi:hypothetical protein